MKEISLDELPVIFHGLEDFNRVQAASYPYFYQDKVVSRSKVVVDENSESKVSDVESRKITITSISKPQVKTVNDMGSPTMSASTRADSSQFRVHSPGSPALPMAISGHHEGGDGNKW
jgi:hypothetical protein